MTHERAKYLVVLSSHIDFEGPTVEEFDTLKDARKYRDTWTNLQKGEWIAIYTLVE